MIFITPGKISYEHLTTDLVGDVSQVLQKAQVSHSMEGITFKYAKSSKLYLEREGGVLHIEAECGEATEVVCATVPLTRILDLAGVQYEVDV